MIKVALICGGPSLERGISLNSARSVLDHLSSDDIEIVPFYLDFKKRPYKISPSQLYSNTPSDFDFKLHQTAKPLTNKKFVELLKHVAIVFPVMHGPYGEDGGIQGFLEKYNIPFVGASSKTCKYAFDKFKANEYIKKHDFFTLPSTVLKIYHQDHKQIIQKFFNEHKIQRAVVKPASGGSSIGVFSVSTPGEALEKASLLFSKRMDTRVVIEPFAQGIEFTIIILQNKYGLPSALVPTEIEADYTEHQIFDFRKKYLPTRQVTYHCPPRFSPDIIEKIQVQAEQLFSLFQMRDFARFDGWVMPDGNIWFSDFNPISGMEQNSFLFQQASRVGLSHRDVLQYILKRALSRYNVRFDILDKKETSKSRKSVNVLFGGDTSERQVSLMSGTNVWLKLRNSKIYDPKPYLLDSDGMVWKLPYQLTLNHTVEEIVQNCKDYQQAKNRLALFEKKARLRLALNKNSDSDDFFEPKKITLTNFIKQSDFVFIALHGGDGENGNFQRMLTKHNTLFNGSGEKVSRLCMDKYATAQFIRKCNIDGIDAIPNTVIRANQLLAFNDNDFKAFWKRLCSEIFAQTIIVKPRADGCSSGIVHLYSPDDLKTYANIIKSQIPRIPPYTFKNQIDIIEMPQDPIDDLLFEKFIKTDVIRIKRNTLKYYRKTGWIEATIGVLKKNNAIKALNPSITVAQGEVLTVEEKFQGGTGINITPPPDNVLSPYMRLKVKKRIEKFAHKIGIRGYARIDMFIHVDTGDLFVIEINTLPGLTPSTVFYHQALAGKPRIFPKSLLEQIIKNKNY